MAPSFRNAVTSAPAAVFAILRPKLNEVLAGKEPRGEMELVPPKDPNRTAPLLPEVL